MTVQEVIAKIRAEIKRRLKDYWKICFHDVKAYNEDSNVRELKELFFFLDTLEEPDCKELEDAAKKYAVETNPSINLPCVFCLRDSFKAGANWQKEQNAIKTARIARKVIDGYKEEMMKEAMEGIARPDDCEIWVDLVGYGYKFRDGEKIKLIIIKENEK